MASRRTILLLVALGAVSAAASWTVHAHGAHGDHHHAHAHSHDGLVHTHGHSHAHPHPADQPVSGSGGEHHSASGGHGESESVEVAAPGGRAARHIAEVELIGTLAALGAGLDSHGADLQPPEHPPRPPTPAPSDALLHIRTVVLLT